MENVKLQIVQDEKIKLSPEELDELQRISNGVNEITTSLGKIEIDKLFLKNNRNTLLSSLDELYKSQDAFGKKLAEKYGDGTIDMASGEFTKVG
jgi:hypothetical protein